MGRARKSNGRPLHGWLPIAKAPGLTSFKVVAHALRITGAAKAGHGGTLDPFAEGVLPIAFGEATKTLAMVLEGDKEYRCWIRFGLETDSGDCTGTTTWQTDQHPEPEALLAALPRFTGLQEQVPPLFSAVHVNGERAYELARRGETIELPPRMVELHEVLLEEWADPFTALVRVRCGKGTYMRSLARDLGRHLGCGAHLTRLARLATLGFTLDQAISLEKLQQVVENDQLETIMLPIDRVLDGIPALRLGEETWRKVRNGQSVTITATDVPSGPVRMLDPSGVFRGLGHLDGVNAIGQRNMRPKRLMQTT